MSDTPPELVQLAEEIAVSFGIAVMDQPAPALVAETVANAAGEMRRLFPHLDDATLTLFAHYVAGVAGGLAQTCYEEGDPYSGQAYLAMANGYIYLTAWLGQAVLAAS